MKSKRTLAISIVLTLVAMTAVSCNKSNSTPSKTFQTFYQAVKNKDVKAMKSVMSKESLAEGEKAAQSLNKSFDDLLKETFDRPDSPKLPDQTPEFRNETIASDGKTATLEVKDPTGKGSWETLRFTKEDDGWKLDFGK